MQFYHDTSRNLLIYERPSPLLLQHIPEARQVNGSCVAFPFTLRNAQVAQRLRHPTPAIITDQNYDWPIEPGYTPLPHQKIYANFQAMNPRSFNLGDPGTMKTLSALWSMDWLIKQHPPDSFRTLIIAPLTILETVWAKSLFKNFMGRRTFEILHGSAEKRRSLLAKKADVYILNFDGVGIGAHTRNKFELDGFSKDLAERDDIKLVIVDEARAYGDATTKRSRIARMVIGSKPYLWQLSGSPTPQAPTDCYGMAKLTNNVFGKSFRTFQAETMLKVSQFRWVPQKDGYEKARRILTPAVRFSLDEIWDGPEQTVQQREVPLTDEQQKKMIELKRDLQILAKDGRIISVAHEAAARQKLLQISLGAIYHSDHKVELIDSAPRLHEITQIIESTQRKVLVFVPLTSVVHLLYKHLSKRWRCEIINGEVSPKKRPGIIRAFEVEDDLKVMIADPTTVSHGVNEFVVADTGVWYGAVDKVDDWIQGNKRIRRPGQKYPSTIFQLVSNKTEKEIFRRLETNTSLQGLMLDAVRKGDL